MGYVRSSRGAAIAATLAAALLLALPLPALAHGDAAGARHFVEDYAVLLFLVAVVLVGAGVLVWVMLAPQSPAESADGESP